MWPWISQINQPVIWCYLLRPSFIICTFLYESKHWLKFDIIGCFLAWESVAFLHIFFYSKTATMLYAVSLFLNLYGLMQSWENDDANVQGWPPLALRGVQQLHGHALQGRLLRRRALQ
jgi:hypothetical protein